MSTPCVPYLYPFAETRANFISVCSSSPRSSSRAKGLTSRVLKGHSSYVFCVNYNTEGTQLVSGGCDGDVKIWNAAKGAFCVQLWLR